MIRAFDSLPHLTRPHLTRPRITRTRATRLALALVVTLLAPVASLAQAPATQAPATQPPGSQAAAAAPHDMAFWRDIAKKDYAVPAGESAFALIGELDRWIGSPDPEQRDDLGFTLTAVWISYRPQLSADQLVTLLDRWRPGLMKGLDASATGGATATATGNASGDPVLARSFTALRLAALAERDLTQPFLGAARYNVLLDEALGYLRAETDLRGFERGKGWFHATAHTADLLKYLARNPLLAPADQARILDGVSQRLASAPIVFTHGEQDRLAQALAAIIRREDFDATAFTAWLTRGRDANKAALRTQPLDPAALTAYQNTRHLLEALFARLSKGDLSAPGVAARTALLDVIATRWRSVISAPRLVSVRPRPRQASGVRSSDVEAWPSRAGRGAGCQASPHAASRAAR